MGGCCGMRWCRVWIGMIEEVLGCDGGEDWM